MWGLGVGGWRRRSRTTRPSTCTSPIAWFHPKPSPHPDRVWFGLGLILFEFVYCWFCFVLVVWGLGVGGLPIIPTFFQQSAHSGQGHVRQSCMRLDCLICALTVLYVPFDCLICASTRNQDKRVQNFTRDVVRCTVENIQLLIADKQVRWP